MLSYQTTSEVYSNIADKNMKTTYDMLRNSGNICLNFILAGLTKEELKKIDKIIKERLETYERANN